MRVQFGMVLAVTLLAACATKPAPIGGAPDLAVTAAGELPVPTEADAYAPRIPTQIGIGDRLSVVVFGIPELSLASVQVASDGRIAMPLIGPVEASGRNSDELSADLTAKLASYVRNPRVTVSVIEPVQKVVTVTGEVEEPGQYPVTWNSTLMTAVATAKGSTEFSKLQDVVIYRTIEGQRYAALYDLRAIQRGNYSDPRVYANDIIMVGDSPGRRLFREVLQAGPALLSPLIYIFR